MHELHIATQEMNTHRVAYHVFDMFTRKWTTINEEVVASITPAGAYCVSIECRYPNREPVIYFQGKLEDIAGFRPCERGWYSIKYHDVWREPVMVTPDPGQYVENLEGWLHGNVPSTDCWVERVIAGNENRMHFFYQVWTGVSGPQITPDEYSISMQEDFSFAPYQNWGTPWISFGIGPNMGTPCLNESRSKIYVPQLIFWWDLFISVYVEGYQLAREVHTSPDYYASMMMANVGTHNPSVFCGAVVSEEDGIEDIYVAMVKREGFLGQGNTYVTHYRRSRDGETGWEFTVPVSGMWTEPKKLGYTVNAPDFIYSFTGQYLSIMGNLYIAFFHTQAQTFDKVYFTRIKLAGHNLLFF
jgi:hypothetical protein